MDKSFVLAPIYRDLKHPTGRPNFYDTPGHIPKLILTLRYIPFLLKECLHLNFDSHRNANCKSQETNKKDIALGNMVELLANLSKYQ